MKTNIHLEKINYDNYDAVIDLSVRQKQKNYVADNIYSLAEAFAARESGETALPFAIYNGKRLVGFCMIGFNCPLGENDDPEKCWFLKGNYEIWRFMIDKRYQGRGYGKEAFKKVLDYIKTWPCGKAEYAWLSYEPENEVAKNMYTSFGFKEVPDVYDGDNWDEIPAVLKL
ncbi:MAG: GNAT family N-acetyltransferase [Clostridia bacterium]|nr:GNAT family N-acetyltransferase [Clostridia bacterium]